MVLARVEKEIGKNLKFLRSNKGREFISNEFEMFVMIEVSKYRHLHLEPLYKMELAREEIGLLWIVLEL